MSIINHTHTYEGSSKMALKKLPISKANRLAIYLRDGMACAYCGAKIEDGAILSLDHIVTQSEGGSHSHTNLVTACTMCNSRRGNRSVSIFAAGVAAYLNVKPEAITEFIAAQIAKDIAPFVKEAIEIRKRRNAAIEIEEN